MNRRGFLGSILALGAAPAIVRAESLMKLWVPREPTWIGVDLAEVRNMTAVVRREFYYGERWFEVDLYGDVILSSRRDKLILSGGRRMEWKR